MSKKNQTKLVARKEPEVETTTTVTEATPPAPSAKEAKEAAVAAKKAAKEAEKAAKKAEREAAKAAKKDKPARETPAHMAKVQKYAASLPTMSEDAETVFSAAGKLTTGELNVLSAHISLLARTRATASASTVKFKEGDSVRIHSGNDTRFIGKEGVVTRVQRIRIFVKVPGFKNDVYVFASNCEPLTATAQQIDISDDAPDSADTAVNG